MNSIQKPVVAENQVKDKFGIKVILYTPDNILKTQKYQVKKYGKMGLR